ncbi:MAG: hypothetical protein C0582_05965 [Alphaproteobacteria bacterium]|nr:MAG: hypothetical protein C0582_05965 [Alphaproteobacteria bacterium]
MIMWNELLTGLGTALSVVALLYYLWATIQKKIFLHAFSWLIWGTTVMVSYLAQLTENTGIGSLVTLAVSIQCFLIGIFSFFYSKSNTFSRGDWITLLASIIAIIFWIFTSNPLYAVIIITIADTFGYYPTLRKSFLFPKEDMPGIFLIGSIKFGLSIFTFNEHTLVNTLFPAAATIVDASVFFMIVIRRYQLQKKM